MDDENKNIVRQYIEEVINAGKADIIGKYISPYYTEIYNNRRYKLGIEGAKKHIMGVRATYPDLYLSIDHQISDGDWVATCYTMKGTNLGEWMGMKPTGRTIEVKGINIDRVVDGKIIEHGSTINLLDPLLDNKAERVMNTRSL